MPAKIAAVLVTYNRQRLLAECLQALLGQTLRPDRIILIDNASTDETPAWLRQHGFLENPYLDYIRLADNLGGAGGFHVGVRHGFEAGYDWLWLMDDDARPERTALQELLSNSADKTGIYGSVAVSADNGSLSLCWPANLHNGKTITFWHELTKECQEISNLPFLGLFIHHTLIAEIGFPDKDFFLSCDDVDYCERAKTRGSRIYLVKNSLIYHPLPNRRTVHWFGKPLFFLNLPPWKRYYDVRNRIIVARRHYGTRLWTQTLPGLALRLLNTLRYGQERRQQIAAFLHGVYDGFTDRTGKRWPPP